MEQALIWFTAGLGIGLMVGIAVTLYFTLPRGGV